MANCFLNDYTILVNKTNPLDASYVPKDLIITDQNENNFHNYYDKNQKPRVREIVLTYFILMKEAAQKAGFNIIIDSGYRSFVYQKQIWEENVKEKGLEETKKSVALPGTSEHQTGLAIDIAYFNNGIYSDEVKGLDKEVIWLKNNAYRFGFILRYPEDKTNITGYKYEPWHYRFVGISLATLCYLNNLTLEEYYLYKDQINNESLIKTRKLL